jgi:aspartate/methionine/tyrosine aminotransferase
MADRFSTARRELYPRLKVQFPSSPIRLVSQMDRVLRAERDYTGVSVAVGDLDEENLPAPLRDGVRAFKQVDEGLRALLLAREGLSLERYQLTGTGYAPLRRGWAGLFREETGLDYDPSDHAAQVFVTHGGMQAIFNTLIAAAASRDWASRVAPGHRPRLFLPTPFFPCVLTQANLLGLEVVPYDTTAAEHFHPSADRLRAERPLADVYYVMTTSNPTSLGLDADPASPTSLQAVVEAILEVNPDATLLLDAVYNRTLPGDASRRMLGFLQHHPARDHVVFVESLSKTHAFTGTRAGVAFTSNPTLAARLRDLGLDAMAGPSNLPQWRAASVLRPWWDEAASPDDRAAGRAFVRDLAAHLSKRRARLVERMLADPDLGPWLLPLAEQAGLAAGADGPSAHWQGGLYAWLALHPERVADLQRRPDLLPDERQNPALHLFFETGLASVGGRGFACPLVAADARKAAIAAATSHVRVSVGTTSDADLGL